MEFRSPGNPVLENSDHMYLAYISYNFCNAVLNGLSQRLKPLEITPVQMAIIYRCHTGDACTVTELAQIVPIDATAISRQVEQLVKKRLLWRQYSKNDRRMVYLSLMEKAQRLVPEIIRHRQENEASLLAGVSEKERETLTSTIQKILANSEN